jgi:arsenate reductase (thioredoxin)
MSATRQRVLILCTGNSARSQMAEGLLRHFAGETFAAYSAGTHPSTVHPLAVAAMHELGIDISTHRSKSVNEFVGEQFDTVITVCDSAAAACPFFPGAPRRIHWSVPDPAAASGLREQRLQAFRSVRDTLVMLLKHFLAPPNG